MSPRHFNYPGDTPALWDSVYFGKGEYAGNDYVGDDFPNTAYVHVYKTTHDVYTDSIAVIQYFYFYPYNHWWNRHEGDWQRIHVVLSSRDHMTAEVLGIEYLFHKAHLSYYKDFPVQRNSLGQSIADGDAYQPDLTTSFTFNPQESLKLSQGTHPIVYVGSGSHASLPVGGRIRIFDRDFEVGDVRLGYEIYESMTHTGKVLSTQVDDSHGQLWESYDLVILPEPDRSQTTNMGLADSMSWLGADVLWGTPSVGSPHTTVGVAVFGNDGPPGPYHKGWESLEFYGHSATGPRPVTDPFLHSDLPDSYHHWTVIGQETWNETASAGEDTVSLSGDIVVFPGATLTISAGTVIEFAPGQDRHQFSAGGTGVDDRTEIFVYGTLLAKGTSTDSVRFQKSGTAGGIDAWGGIRKIDGGSVILDYTEIRDTLPGPPTDLQAERGDAQATLRWSKPNHFGITGWKYRSGTIAGTDTTWAVWQAMDSSDGDTESHAIEDLVNGTTYTFQVRAVNPTGDGPSSGASAAVIPAGPPEPPELTVGEGHEKVFLSWTPGDDNGSAIQRHELRYSGDGGTTWNPDWRTHSVRSDTIRNLINDTEYTFQMRARNEVDYSEVAEAMATPRHPIRGRTAVDFAEHRPDTVATYRFRAPAGLAEIPYRLQVSDIEDSTHFELDGKGGLRFRAAPDFEDPKDTGEDNLYVVWLRAAPVSGGGGPLNPRAAPPPTFTRRVEVTVTNVEEPGTVALSPATAPQVGASLTATLSDPDESISSTDWQWQGRAPKTTGWTTLSGTTAGRSAEPEPSVPERSTYKPLTNQVDWVLRAVVNHYVDGHGAGKRAVSGETDAVLANGPTAPRNFTASAEDSRVTLSWTAPESNRGAAITGYAYRYTEDENTSDETSWTTGTLGVTTGHGITGLDNGTPYTFELWAVNSAAAGDTATAQATPAGAFTLAAAGRDEYVSLSWTPAPVSGPPVTRYRYRRSDDGGSTWTGWSTVWVRFPGHADEPLFYQVQNLTNDVEYLFELRAFNADGQVGEASATATPTATPGADIRLLSVSYGAATYRATEGDSVSVAVRLSRAADRAVDIPITGTANTGTEPGDYRISGLSPADTVSFAQNSASQTFHVVALTDTDTDDETVTLGFGTMPAGVLAGTTSSTTVTLVDTTGTSGPLTISGPASVCYDKDRTDAVASYEARDAQANPVPSAAWTLSGVDSGAFGVNAGVLRFDPAPSFDNPTDDGADNVYNVSLRAEEGARRSDLFPVAVSVVNADDGSLTLSPDPPVAGQTVRATLVDLDGGATNLSWRWTKSPASSGPRYSLVGASYTPEASDVGKTLTVTVTYDDRCSSGNTLSVTSQAVESPPADTPDLVVGSPSVTDNTPATGASFTLSATVRNQGTGSAAATTLRYYRSTNSTISDSDTEVGTDAVGALAASGTSAESVSLTAPSTAGTYYYGACVDAVTGEAETGNNCSGAVKVVVGQPDLVVESPSVSDNTPAAGASFTLSATVRNQGGGSAAATTLRYYRSTDGTISSGDTQLPGTDAVTALAASGTSAESIGLTAPSTADIYYYGACVVAVTGETETGNNCSGAVKVTVGQPDLVVGSPSVSDSTPETEASFTLSATVRNQGGGSAAATTLRYYRSTDATISSGDTQVGTDAVSALAASGTSAESVSLTAPSTAGTYYYGACVDAVTGEAETGNNCSGAVKVVVGQPDLVVESPSVSDNTPAAGASFTLSATVRNQGGGSAAATTLRYYRSANSTISDSDTEVDTDAVGALTASGTSAESVSLTAPSTAGTYYYGACVDAVTGETETGNNCSSAVTVTVGQPPPPDLVVESPSVSDSSPSCGAPFTLSATVRNQGSESSAATTLRYYQSTDQTISTSDTQAGTDQVSALAVSATSAESIGLTAPSTTGTYYYGACVDAVTGETETGNNCSGAVTVTVVNGSPEITSGADASVLEGTSGVVYTGTATDPDGDTVTWSKRDHDHADFNLNSSSAALSFTAAPDFEKPRDGDTDNQYKVTLVATDPKGAEDTQLVTITVTNKDEPGTVTLDISSPYVGDHVTATLTDPDKGIRGPTWAWQSVGTGARSASVQSYRYTVPVSDFGKHLEASVGYDDNHGCCKSATGSSSEPVRAHPPDPPPDFEAARGDGEVVLTWGKADGHGAPVLGYSYQYRSDTGTWPGFTSVSGLTHTIGSLTNGTLYHFQVRARNIGGPGSPSTDTATPAGRPGAPSGFSHGRSSAKSVRVSWDEPEDNGSDITGYYWSKKGTFFWDSDNWVTTTHFVDNQSLNTATHLYRVSAMNGVGQGPWAEYTVAAQERSPPPASKLLAGMALEDLADSTGFGVRSAPNPFNSNTMIYLAIPEDLEVTLTVYSLTGQTVARLHENHLLEAGIHSLQWRGVDAHGRPVASGLYLFRLIADREVRVGKMALIR